MAAHDIGGRRPLREHRLAHMFTQQRVAERLEQLAWLQHRRRIGVNADMVSKWERGEKRPSAFYLELLCSLYDASPGELGFPVVNAAQGASPAVREAGPGPTLSLLEAIGVPVELLYPTLYGLWREDVLGRRAILKAMGIAPLALGLDLVDVPLGLPAPVPVSFRGAETVDQLEAAAAALERSYHSAAPQLLVMPAQALAETAGGYVAQSRSQALQARLLSVVSRSELLAGRLTFFDLHQPMDARAHLELAREAAIEASDPLLAGAALGHMAFLPAERMHFVAATSYLDGARGQLSELDVPVLQAWLCAVTAEVNTIARKFGPALSALEQARQQVGKVGQGMPPTWFDFFDEGRLSGFEGFTLRKLGAVDAARQRLEQALGPGSNLGPKQRAVSLIDLAMVCLEQGDLDAGCALATDALLGLQQAGYAKALDRLQEFKGALPDAKHPAAKLLEEAVADLS